MACLFHPLKTVGFTDSLLVKWASDWLARIAGVPVRFVNISALSAIHGDSEKKSRTLGMSTITGRWVLSPPIPCSHSRSSTKRPVPRAIGWRVERCETTLRTDGFRLACDQVPQWEGVGGGKTTEKWRAAVWEEERRRLVAQRICQFSPPRSLCVAGIQWRVIEPLQGEGAPFLSWPHNRDVSRPVYIQICL